MAVVDEDEAMRRAVRAFYEDGNFEEYEKTRGKKSKYSKDFFDGYEKELRKSMSKKTKGQKKDMMESLDQSEVDPEEKSESGIEELTENEGDE